MLCSANDISAICSIPTKNITTKLVRTYRYTRTRRSRVLFRLSVARWRCRFWADCTINISERKFPTGTGAGVTAPRTLHLPQDRLVVSGHRRHSKLRLHENDFVAACLEIIEQVHRRFSRRMRYPFGDKQELLRLEREYITPTPPTPEQPPARPALE
jgi:hypothetical protein